MYSMTPRQSSTPDRDLESWDDSGIHRAPQSGGDSTTSLPPKEPFFSSQSTIVPLRSNLTPSSTFKSLRSIGSWPQVVRRQHSNFRDKFLPQHSKPSSGIVLSYLGVFICFAVLLCIAARLPFKAVWLTVMIIGGICSVGMTVYYFLSHLRGNNEDYRPNLGNTVAVVLLTIPLFTVLYVTLWYPSLRDDVWVETSDSVTNVRFPSIAIFQRDDWTSQGELLGTSSDGTDSKCFLGWYDDSAPTCESLSEEKLGNSTRCNCEELWYDNGSVVEGFVWMNATYRYTVFDAPAWLSSDTPTYLMTLQTFFTFNMTKALSDSSTQNPTLFIAAYDSELGLQSSFEKGYTRMTLVNANGMVALNIGLRIRQGSNRVSAYDYELGVSSAPARDMVCDTTSALTYQYPCHLSLFIQIPNFQRTIYTEEKVMHWADVAASAGAYFSFVQFVSWVISGQAFMM